MDPEYDAGDGNLLVFSEAAAQDCPWWLNRADRAGKQRASPKL